MASAKDLKKRISTVKNTQQTTRAMKMVSAAKLRRAQEAITNQRPYARRLQSLMQFLVASVDVPFESPLLRREPMGDGGTKRRVLLVVVTSDRGLCGGFNSNIIKATQRWVLANQASCEFIELAFVGRRGFDFFKTRKFKMGQNFTEVSGKVTFAKAKTLSAALVDAFASGRVDEVKIVYNEFKNAVSQKVLVEDFLPLLPPSSATAGEGGGHVYIVKPDPVTVLEELLSKHFPVQAFRILLDSQASEHGARMSAMENATKNAGEMIRKLTLEYNKQRQANITKELLEIISGSESQKSAG